MEQKKEMNVEEKITLIKKNTIEVLGEEDLFSLMKGMEIGRTPPKHYIGFEISGKIHLGTGLMCMQKVRDFMDAGIECSIFLADWHSWINDKLGGNPNAIKKIAVGYFKEGMKASLKCIGGNPDKLKFVLGTDLYHNNDLYWLTLIEVSKHVTLSRIRRRITIMGRKEEDNIDFAKLIYPPMQVADIFAQGIKIAHAGIDQRKAQVIARDVANSITFSPIVNNKGKQMKPVAIHHPLILGLGKPPIWPIPKNTEDNSERIQDIWSSLKMSKSKPDTCIFIHDSPEEITRKIKKAFCPEKEVEFNPIIDWAEKIILPMLGEIQIKRPKEFGGDISYNSIDSIKNDFAVGKIHPADLKNSITYHIISILKPAREHFSKGNPKKMLDELEKLLQEKC